MTEYYLQQRDSNGVHLIRNSDPEEPACGLFGTVLRPEECTMRWSRACLSKYMQRLAHHEVNTLSLQLKS